MKKGKKTTIFLKILQKIALIIPGWVDLSSFHGVGSRILTMWLDGETVPMDNIAYEINDLLGLGVWNHDEYSDDYYRIRRSHNHG